MADVVTLGDVEALLGRDLSAMEALRAQALIPMAEAELGIFLPGFDFGPATTETVTVPGTWDDVLYTPRWPVSAVASVSLAGLTLPPSTLLVSKKGSLRRRFDYGFGTVTGTGPGIGLGSGAPWGGPNATVTIVYTHGSATRPADLVAIVATAVADAIRLQDSNPGGVQSERIGTYEVRYDRKSDAFGLLAGAETVLRRYRRHQAYTSRIDSPYPDRTMAW